MYNHTHAHSLTLSPTLQRALTYIIHITYTRDATPSIYDLSACAGGVSACGETCACTQTNTPILTQFNLRSAKTTRQGDYRVPDKQRERERQDRRSRRGRFHTGLGFYGRLVISVAALHEATNPTHSCETPCANTPWRWDPCW